jgi:hypothetical protein
VLEYFLASDAQLPCQLHRIYAEAPIRTAAVYYCGYVQATNDLLRGRLIQKDPSLQYPLSVIAEIGADRKAKVADSAAKRRQDAEASWRQNRVTPAFWSANSRQVFRIRRQGRRTLMP